MLERLTKDELSELAEKNDVRVDKRWARDRIVEALAKAGVDAPKRKTGTALTDKIANEPVRFSSTAGRVRIRDAKQRMTEYGPVEDPGLVVDFGTGHGEEATLTGGLSREFYPDLDDHDDETAYCQCAKCLAEVRDYIALDKHRICERFHMIEADLNAPNCPLPSAKAWQDIHADDLAALHKQIGFDLENAARYEQRTHKRGAVLSILDELAADPEVIEDSDILAAELEV